MRAKRQLPKMNPTMAKGAEVFAQLETGRGREREREQSKLTFLMVLNCALSSDSSLRRLVVAQAPLSISDTGKDTVEPGEATYTHLQS